MSTYILSSWLPSLVGAAVIELAQKALVEFNPSPSAVAVLRVVLAPAGGKTVGALVPGRWLEERKEVTMGGRQAAAAGKRRRRVGWRSVAVQAP